MITKLVHVNFFSNQPVSLTARVTARLTLSIREEVRDYKDLLYLFGIIEDIKIRSMECLKNA